jgi:hypothetical protein
MLWVRNIRVVIYSNDHPPPHVHAVRGNDARAKFNLNCASGPVQLVGNEGFKKAETTEIGEAIAASLENICRKWSEIHGSV